MNATWPICACTNLCYTRRRIIRTLAVFRSSCSRLVLPMAWLRLPSCHACRRAILRFRQSFYRHRFPVDSAQFHSSRLRIFRLPTFLLCACTARPSQPCTTMETALCAPLLLCILRRCQTLLSALSSFVITVPPSNVLPPLPTSLPLLYSSRPMHPKPQSHRANPISPTERCIPMPRVLCITSASHSFQSRVSYLRLRLPPLAFRAVFNTHCNPRRSHSTTASPARKFICTSCACSPLPLEISNLSTGSLPSWYKHHSQRRYYATQSSHAIHSLLVCTTIAFLADHNSLFKSQPNKSFTFRNLQNKPASPHLSKQPCNPTHTPHNSPQSR